MEVKEEEKQEMAIVEEEEEEGGGGGEEEDDDGPPPGFQCIITPQPPKEEKADDDEEEEDGPPPGFAPQPSESLPSSDMPRSSEQGIDDVVDDDDNDDEDGPPPGWGFSSLVNALPKPTSSTTGIKEDSNEELDDGPPPGWELPCQMPPPRTQPLQLPSVVSSNSLGTETEIKQTNTGDDNEGPPEEPQHMPMPGRSSPATPPLKQSPSSELPFGNKDGNNKNEKKLMPVHKPASRPQQPRPNPRPLTPAAISPSEKAQLVCGTCRKLCVYPRGSKWVQCPGCHEVNFVLEAQEVGQVKCGGCSVLLMYPHGAPAVQCSSCRFVTEIGAQNRRAPLSVQQAEVRAQAQAQRRHCRSSRAR